MDSQKLKAKYLRNKVLDMCVKAGTGHIASCYSSVEIMVALYYQILKGDDKFILSKGHACTLLYAILDDLGKIPKGELDKFCQADGILGAHPEKGIAEITSGSLGHGLGIGAGMALANRNRRVFVLMSDGECYEGSTWEAIMFAGSHQLNNLIAIVDRNYICATDFTEDVVKLERLDKKWEAFGWDVLTINGHSFEQLISGFNLIHNKPLVIIANTVKGKGVSFMEVKPEWQTMIPRGEQIETAKRELK